MDNLFIWDGDCGFCKFWITRLKVINIASVEFVPYQRLNKNRCAGIPAQRFKSAVHLIESNGAISIGAAAFIRYFQLNSRFRLITKSYLACSLLRRVIDHGYVHVAAHRYLYSKLLRRVRILPDNVICTLE